MEKLADAYFASLNSVCRGIIKEKRNFASLLGDQWNSLPVSEQDALLDEHFIAPHIKALYYDGEDVDVPQDMYPILRIKTGQKMVEDDEGEIWQDEHSGPFSWETSSQSELVMDEADRKPKSKDPKRPKSPRVLMRNNSGGDHSQLTSLDRRGSTDFQNLRAIWESHRESTNEEDQLPFGQFVLSRSQVSIDKAGVGETLRRPSVELDSMDVKGDYLPLGLQDYQDWLNFAILGQSEEADEPAAEVTLDDASTLSLKSFNPTDTGATAMSKTEDQRGSFRSTKTTSSVQSAKSATTSDYHEGGSSTTAEVYEEDRLSTGSQYDNIRGTSPEKNMTASEPEKTKEDILDTYGVTFSYADDDTAGPSASYSSPVTEDTKKDDPPAAMPSTFDFLSSW